MAGPDLSPALRVVGRGAVAVTALGLGALIGAVAERSLLRGSGPSLGEDPEDLGSLHGAVVTVVTEDGVELQVEVDEPTDGDGDDVPVDDGLTVVFCHGYALSMDAFHYQRRDLRGKARLVFYDQRSHGHSGRAEFDSHHIDQLGRDLYAVIDAVAPTGPLMLVGHSMGGMTVMALADQRPELFAERVFGVALIATTAGGLTSGMLGLPGALGPAIHRLGPAVAATLARRKSLVEKSGWSTSDLGLLLTRIYSFGSTGTDEEGRFVASMLSSTPVDVVAEFLPALQEHDKHAALSVLEGVELLVVVGDRDRLTPKPFSDEIVRRVPGAEYVVVPDAGHMVLIEKHEVVDEHLLALLDRVRRDIAADTPTPAPTSGSAPADLEVERD
jgi:pimeloyl-ACP methyl ester carboxylesterase